MPQTTTTRRTIIDVLSAIVATSCIKAHRSRPFQHTQLVDIYVN